jgi:AAA domain
VTKNYRRISVFVHGWWGSGKSWLAASAPGPRLILDTEGGSFDTPGEHVVWAPRTPFPEGLTKDHSVVVDASSWEVVHHVMDILLEGNHPFESVIIDSLHELQEMVKQSVAVPGETYDPNAVFERQAWGRLKNNMGLLMRQLRDLTRTTARKRVNVVIVSGSDDEMIPAKPLLEGGARKIALGFFDVVGYLRTANSQSGDEVRVLQISPSPSAVAKCRLHNLKLKYGNEIVNPDIRKILAVVNATTPATPEGTA